jgi:hypothetical protein
MGFDFLASPSLVTCKYNGVEIENIFEFYGNYSSLNFFSSKYGLAGIKLERAYFVGTKRI